MEKYEHIRHRLSRNGLDGFLVSEMLNIRYLTGFTGSSAVLFIGMDSVIFFTDFRYKYECEEQLKYEDVVIVKADYYKEIKKKLKSIGVQKLGFEYGAPYYVFEKMKKEFELKTLKGVIEKMRMIKKQGEIKNIKMAVRRAEDAFRKTKKYIRAGVKERKIALLLEHNLKKEGCSRMPFDIIVASGKNSALPHARVTDREIKRGEFVIIDWGGEAAGYVSDMTRTLLMAGDGLTEKRRMYQTVLGANRRTISNIRPNLSGSDIDGMARNYIKSKGYGQFFGHGTGHGVGLNVHEKPAISPRSKDKVKEGIIFTVEPGIYVPELGGVRIEDMVVLKDGMGKCLTTLPKSLEIL
jgi:Xaa-Pro aminopeptidase